MSMQDSDQKIIKDIKAKTEAYKECAKRAVDTIKNVENMRTRIINEIEEAQHQQKLDRRTASLLEDKLSRPYVKLLVV